MLHATGACLMCPHRRVAEEGKAQLASDVFSFGVLCESEESVETSVAVLHGLLHANGKALSLSRIERQHENIIPAYHH